MTNQKGSIRIELVAIILIIVAALLYMVWTKEQNNQRVLCTTEGKVCPDGKTTVSRVPPTCEFSACPETQDETAGWKVYNNTKFDFSFQVPSNWILIKENEEHPNGVNFITILQSPDYQEKHYESSFRTDITSGVRVVIDLQYPSVIKTMKEMIDFWNLGRGGHIKKSENFIKVGGRTSTISLAW